MSWQKIRCWFTGHDVRRATAVIKEDSKYHGHATTRKYGKCARCDKGTLENELSGYSDECNLFERHAVFFNILLFFGAFAAVIAVVTAFVLVGQSYSCRINGEIMELPWKFNRITGNCYYQMEGRWIARSLLTVVDILK